MIIVLVLGIYDSMNLLNEFFYYFSLNWNSENSLIVFFATVFEFIVHFLTHLANL